MAPTIVSIANHKGGCLKTSVTVNLGAALARLGKRVLLIDLDAQQNLTQSLIGAIPYAEGDETLYEALADEISLGHLIRTTPQEGLDIIPCTEDFAGFDLMIVNLVGRELILKRCLDQTHELGTYDFILLDNPPSLSLVVANSLAASDYFLVPCSAEYLPMAGLSTLSKSVSNIQRKVAPDVRFFGVVLTMFARSETICRQTETLLRKELKGQLFDTVIRVNTKAKAAPAVRKTIFDYERSEEGRGTQDYSQLAHEFLARLAAANSAALVTEVANG